MASGWDIIVIIDALGHIVILMFVILVFYNFNGGLRTYSFVGLKKIYNSSIYETLTELPSKITDCPPKNWTAFLTSFIVNKIGTGHGCLVTSQT